MREAAARRRATQLTADTLRAALLLLVGTAALAEPLRGYPPPGDAVVGEPSARRAPSRLSETGLYAADGTIDERNRSFVPQYPLWTDGAGKSRWVRLPDGATIDVSDVDAWRFPAGTTFWKEFAWGARKVETRMIRREADGTWTFAAYVWADDQRDAVLAPAEGLPGAFDLEGGQRHSVPAVADCHSCHGSAPQPVLGFNALQLSDDRDPLAPHAEPLPADAVTLRTLESERRFTPSRPEFVSAPPRIRTTDPVERAALGYLTANCGGCHNDRGPLARLQFSLLHDTGAAPDAPEPGHATTAGVRGRYLVPGVPAEASRLVAPGAPASSSLLHRMRSRRAASQMPPLGTTIADADGVAIVQRWIESLAAPEPGRVAVNH